MLSKNQAREIRSLHLKKFREAKKLYIAEGFKTVSEILYQRPGSIQAVFADAVFLSRFAGQLNAAGVGSCEVNEEELRTISLQSTPNHVLAVCRQPEPGPLPAPGSQGFSFYLDDIRDPGNFGTIIRLCDWFGARALYCSPGCCELYNPKVIQATMGAFLRVQVHYLPLDELLAVSGSARVYGAVLDGKDLYAEPLQGGLVLIGNEANGISPGNLQRVTHPVTIPAHDNNGSESLNAAMATAIIASEFYRQLRGK